MSGRRIWLSNIAVFLAGLLAAAFVLWWANIGEVAARLRGASSPLVAASAATLCGFYVLRAVRWSFVLKTRVSVLPLFLYSSIGYLASLVTPLQAGELLRPGLLRLGHRIPFFEGLGSVGIERLFDVFCLVILGLVSLIVIPPEQLHEQWLTECLRVAGILSAAALVAVFFAVILSPRYGKALSAILKPLPAGLRTRLAAFLGSMLQGADVLKSPGRLMLVFLSSLLLWTVNYLSVLMLFHAFDVPAHPITVLLGFVILSLGIALPLTPGSIGQYEALWTLVFLALGVRPESSLVAIGVLAHALILLVIMFLGLLSVLVLPRSMVRDAFRTASSGQEGERRHAAGEAVDGLPISHVDRGANGS